MGVSGEGRGIRRAVPSFHFRKVWGPGCLAGLLWSLGNFLGIMCIQRLGLAMATPLATCSLVVAALWGLLLYHEGGSLRNRLALLSACSVLLCGAVIMTRYGLSS